MGGIIGGIIGGVGSIAGASIQASAAKKASAQALTGYNYLTKGGGASATSGAVQGGQAAGEATGQLLGTKPITDQTRNGFNNYLQSTGYNFQKQQGENAVTGSAASRGILNSGGTAKRLEEFGQGLAGGAFQNYLGNLNQQQTFGQNASGQVAGAGSAGGAPAGAATQAGGAARATGFNQAGGQFGNVLSNASFGGSDIAPVKVTPQVFGSNPGGYVGG